MYEWFVNNSMKANPEKLYTLKRLRKFLTYQKSEILTDSVIEIQFAYCPLIWMFCLKVHSHVRNTF